MTEHQWRFINEGTYLAMERLQNLVHRSLARRVFLILQPTKGTRIPLQAYSLVAEKLGIELQDDEMECILANLVYEGLMKYVKSVPPCEYLTNFFQRTTHGQKRKHVCLHRQLFLSSRGLLFLCLVQKRLHFPQTKNARAEQPNGLSEGLQRTASILTAIPFPRSSKETYRKEGKNNQN